MSDAAKETFKKLMGDHNIEELLSKQNAARAFHDAGSIHKDAVSAWVSFFHLLSGRAPVPESKIGSAQWISFALMQSPAAIILLVLGLMVVCITIKTLCSFKPEGKHQKPPAWLIIACVLGTFSLLWVSFGAVLQNSGKGWTVAENQVGRLSYDVGAVWKQTKELEPVMKDSTQYLIGFEESCAGWTTWIQHIPGVIHLKSKLEVALVNASTYITMADNILGDVTPTLENVDTQLQDNSVEDFIPFLLAPAILVTVVLTMLTIIALCSGYSSSLAYFVDCCFMRLISLPVALLILVVTVAAAVLLAVCTIFSSLCANPDEGTLSLISSLQHGNGTSFAYQVSQQYITGKGENPILEVLDVVDSVVSPIESNMWLVGPLIGLLGLWCPDLKKANVRHILEIVFGFLSDAEGIVKRDNIYPYYSRTVRVGLCGDVISGFGWMWLCYTLCALVCLPAVCILAHRYLAADSVTYTMVATDAKEKEDDLKTKELTKEFSNSSSPHAPPYACCTRRLAC